MSEFILFSLNNLPSVGQMIMALAVLYFLLPLSITWLPLTPFAKRSATLSSSFQFEFPFWSVSVNTFNAFLLSNSTGFLLLLLLDFNLLCLSAFSALDSEPLYQALYSRSCRGGNTSLNFKSRLVSHLWKCAQSVFIFPSSEGTQAGEANPVWNIMELILEGKDTW